MYDKAVNTYPSTIKSVPECFMTQKMHDKVVIRCFFVFDSISDQYKTQEICATFVSEDRSLIICCSDKYKTQKCLTVLFLKTLL